MTHEQQMEQLASWWQQALNFRQQGNAAQAANLYQKILAVMPGHVDSIQYYALALYQMEKYLDAEKNFQIALSIQPNNFEIHSNYGLLLVATHRPKEAIQHFLRAIHFMPEKADFYLNLGNAYRNNNEPEQALTAYLRAIELNKTLSAAYFSLAEIYRQRRDFGSAEKYLTAAIDHDPNTFNCYTKLVSIKKFTKSDEILIDKIMALGKQDNLSDKQKTIFYFSMGKIYNDLKQHQSAFNYYLQGNEYRKKLSPYTIKNDLDFMERIKITFSQEALSNLSVSGNNNSRPIFIVGMPRSGTTLTEQILSSHPDIYGAGELSYISSICRGGIDRLQKNIPFRLEEIIKQETIKNFSNQYLSNLEQINQSSLHVVDKMPHNFLHIGWIHLMFPNSTIIHIKRNPVDTCLSCYFQNFFPGHSYSDDLQTLGEYYLAYQALMQHWEKVLPNRVLTIQYEDLVSNHKETTSRILQRIGLPWHDNCLEHDKNNRVPNTASHWQACQPTYTSSVQRWMNYQPYIGDLLKALNYDH